MSFKNAVRFAGYGLSVAAMGLGVACNLPGAYDAEIGCGINGLASPMCPNYPDAGAAVSQPDGETSSDANDAALDAFSPDVISSPDSGD